MMGGVLARLRAWVESIGLAGKTRPDLLRIAAQSAARPAARVPAAAAPAATSAVNKDREARIAQRSRALAIKLFGANHPVENPRDLFGRQRELDELCGSVLDGGMHAVIYGPRGSGKTSLVRVFGDIADDRGVSVIYLSCAGGTGFGEIMLPYLDDIDAESFGMRSDEYAEAVAALTAAPTPRGFANLLARIEGAELILILDEFDRLEDHGTKGQLALLVKLLSDMRARVRLVFVGISGDVDELVQVHASVRRHLTAVALKPLADAEVDSFIRTTSRAIGLDFSPAALSLLRWLVCGSPYHMRLYSLQTCLAAIERERKDADDAVVLAGLERAVAGWQATNDRDAALFAAVIEQRLFPFAAVEAFAKLAATSLEFTPDDLARELATARMDPALVPQIVDAFGPALGRMADGSPRLAFDDVLAPQFLLAMCATVRWNEKGRAMAAEGTTR